MKFVREVKAQQEILGLMGVNLIYGAYYKHNKPRSLIKYLYDHIDPCFGFCSEHFLSALIKQPFHKQSCYYSL